MPATSDDSATAIAAEIPTHLQPGEDMWTTAAVAAHLNVSTTYVRRLLNEGQLQGVRDYDGWRVDMASVYAYQARGRRRREQPAIPEALTDPVAPLPPAATPPSPPAAEEEPPWQPAAVGGPVTGALLKANAALTQQNRSLLSAYAQLMDDYERLLHTYIAETGKRPAVGP